MSKVTLYIRYLHNQFIIVVWFLWFKPLPRFKIMLGIKFLGISRHQNTNQSSVMWKRKKLPPEQFYCWVACYLHWSMETLSKHCIKMWTSCPHTKTKNNLYSYIQPSREKNLTEIVSYAFIHKPMCSANLEKTRKISICSRRPMHRTCALKRWFSSPEESVRSHFPAQFKPGLISPAPPQFALAVYPANCSKVTPGAHSTYNSHCPPETRWMFGNAAFETFLAQLSHLLPSKLKPLPAI